MQHINLSDPLIEILNDRKMFEKWNLVIFPTTKSKAVAELICIVLSRELAGDNSEERRRFQEKLRKPIQGIVRKYITLGDLTLYPERTTERIVNAVIRALNDREIELPTGEDVEGRFKRFM